MKERIATMSVPASATIRTAMQAIDRGGLGLALLVEQVTGSFLGVVSDGDIRRALLAGHGLESRVFSIPRPNPRVGHVGMSATEIAAIFTDEVRVVPILDPENRVADLALLDRRAHLPVAGPSFGDKELAYVTECVLTGWVSSSGPFLKRFEEMFAEACGTRYAIATSNGTTALHLAMLALGVGPGDEVIVPTLTFIATANAVRYVGATPVFVDSEAITWNLDPEQVEAAITPRTRAIIAVHLYGHPADLESLRELAHKHNLALVEDAAEALGARYMGMPMGSMGDLGTFSFYGNKIITTGEGGMITTNRAELNARIRLLRDHGMDSERRYWHPVMGYNYRLTNLQAALGVAQMERLALLVEAKRGLAGMYARFLSDIPGLVLPNEAPWAKSIFWLYSVLVDSTVFGCSRDELMARLLHRGIETRPVFSCLHQQPIYATGQTLPVAERIAAMGMSLPSAPGMRADDVERVVQAIREAADVGVTRTAQAAAARGD
jgi:perosamine synthetase